MWPVLHANTFVEPYVRVECNVVTNGGVATQKAKARKALSTNGTTPTLRTYTPNFTYRAIYKCISKTLDQGYTLAFIHTILLSIRLN